MYMERLGKSELSVIACTLSIGAKLAAMCSIVAQLGSAGELSAAMSVNQTIRARGMPKCWDHRASLGDM